MKKGRKYNQEEIEYISKTSIGKSFNTIIKENESEYLAEEYNKGSFGQIVEKYLFGIELNNESEPDFFEAGIELKVTPYRRLKNNELSAKERLVFNIINYEEEYKNQFNTSQFWYKNNKIQLLWYLWEENKERQDFTITHEKLLDLSLSEDLLQIEEDWKLIINKIKSGKAHEISEADTMYLGACTKGVDSASLRKQPFNNILAMQRAFCFKNSYMTQLVRKYIGDYSNVEKILNKKNEKFDSFVEKTISRYIGKSQAELMKELQVDTTAKNLNSILISRMFGVEGKLSETEEFLKAKIVPRTIRIEENLRIKESIPFPAFKYTDIVNQTWENSDLKEELETTKYMFFIFKKENNEYIFKGVKLWNMPEQDIETHVKDMWIQTKEIIQDGNIVKSIKEGKRKTNFVGMSENKVSHVRPHARNSLDTYSLPVKDKLTNTSAYTKHCFWINSNYIIEQIKGIFS